MSDTATRIISLTVTEAGYCLGADGRLDARHPDIAHDLEQGPAHPRSAIGLIVAALRARRLDGNGGVTLLSCDNLVANGRQLEGAVLGFARIADPNLAQWIEQEVSFPCSMVDRITPAPDAQRLALLTGTAPFADAAPIVCEQWAQWVLEDDFVSGRPAWEQAGARFTGAVKDFEDMKVGLLNGGHSALSHVALLLGYRQVHEAMADPLLQRWLRAYMSEVAAVLTPVPAIDFGGYSASLLQRFGNGAIEDRLARLAQDTSGKFQQTLLPPWRRREQRGLSSRLLSAALALWIRYLQSLQSDPAASALYADARKETLIGLAATAFREVKSAAFVAATLALPAAGIAEVDAHLRQLQTQGPREFLERLVPG